VARVGILGGTFNPPHLGHLAVVRSARDELGLARVLLMPAHTAPHKQGEPDPGPVRRLEMCRLLVEGEDGAQACAAEVDRGGTSYTVATLREIHARHPEAELTFITGADSARTMPGWREPQALLELAELAVAARSGAERTDVLEAIATIPGADTGRVRFLEMPQVDVSASLVRERAAAGAPLEGLVGERVARYIAEQHLYSDAAGS
jgi:nicotinate-nucleotide adenylyltransferase